MRGKMSFPFYLKNDNDDKKNEYNRDINFNIYLFIIPIRKIKIILKSLIPSFEPAR